MKKLSVVILIGGVALAGVAVWWLKGPRDHREGLVLQGNVDVRQADFSFKVAGRIAQIEVQEGDRVRAGQVIARLERPDYEADLAAAAASRRQAEAELAELVNGSRPQEIEQARAAVAEDEALLVNLRLTHHRQQDLLRTGDAARAAFDQAEANLRQGEARLANARASLALAVEGARRERIDAARAQLDQASAQQLLAERHLGDTSLTVPEEGVVLSRVREPGTVVNVGDVICSVVLIRPVWIRVYVGEPDLERVHPGKAVDVVTDGGRHYAGKIGYVSPLAEFTPKTVQTPEQRAELVYRLRVVVETPDDALRQGMPVSVRLAGPDAP